VPDPHQSFRIPVTCTWFVSWATWPWKLPQTLCRYAEAWIASAASSVGSSETVSTPSPPQAMSAEAATTADATSMNGNRPVLDKKRPRFLGELLSDVFIIAGSFLSSCLPPDCVVLALSSAARSIAVAYASALQPRWRRERGEATVVAPVQI